MNSHCSVCDVEQQCGYQYKPCDCCNYRKFTPKLPQPLAKVYPIIDWRAKRTATNGESRDE